jgi:hypothetical protein
MRHTPLSFVLAVLVASPNVFAADPGKELSWSSVHLEGASLRLVSPKAKGHSLDLGFGADGNLAITSCTDGTCTGPLTVWKIENNRLKTGYAPTEGAALIAVSARKLTLREPSGKIVVYEIVRRSGT